MELHRRSPLFGPILWHCKYRKFFRQLQIHGFQSSPQRCVGCRFTAPSPLFVTCLYVRVSCTGISEKSAHGDAGAIHLALRMLLYHFAMKKLKLCCEFAVRIVATTKEISIVSLPPDQFSSASRTNMICHLQFALGDILSYVSHMVDSSVGVGDHSLAQFLCKSFHSVGSKCDCLIIQYVFAQLNRI